MIIVPKLRIAEAELGTNTGLSGRFMMTKYKAGPDGNPILASAVVVADWFDNIITNQGLNRIGTHGDWLDSAHVGSGTSTPQATDAGLQSFIAGSNNRQSSTGAAQTNPPYYGFRTVTYRFNAGTATGNLSEVGVGWATSGSTLFSRALILDGGGNPTTITVLADEVLDITYQIRVYPPTNDSVSAITISGLGSVTTTTRAAYVTAGSWGLGPIGDRGGFAWGSPSFANSFSDSITAVTTGPSGTSSNCSGITNAAYANNSFQNTAQVLWGLNNGNFNVSSVALLLGQNNNSFGYMQVGFGTPIPKTAANTLSLNFVHSWSRRVL